VDAARVGIDQQRSVASPGIRARPVDDDIGHTDRIGTT
jgi:hypothetical protein